MTPDIQAFAELKATRDVLEHASGIANAVYVKKAGAAKRFLPGAAVTVDDPYHTAAFQLVRRLISDLAGAAITAA